MYTSSSKNPITFGSRYISWRNKLHLVIFEEGIDIPCPKWNDLKQANNHKEILRLIPPEANAPWLKCQHVMPIPLVVWITILQAKSMEAANLIPIISAVMQEFNENSTTIKSCETKWSMLYFQWAITQGEVTACATGTDKSDDGQNWTSKQHQLAIIQNLPAALLLAWLDIPGGES